jgi:membrane protease YdiL (CAAX protease family)
MTSTPTKTANVDTDPRAKELPQYTLRQILAVWAAATIPIGVLGWIGAPWLSEYIDSRDPFIDSLLICFNLALLWMVVLVLILVRREQGSLAWARVREALWLWAPRDPRTGRIGGRIWLWVLPFILLSGVVNALPIDPTGPLPRDLPAAILTDRVADYFDGNLYAFAMLVANAFLSPIAEELLFRGLLLPRMRSAFGKADIFVNGLLFALYHLHQPWSMPAALIDGTLNQAYPTRRFQSTWMSLITHTAPSFLVVAVIARMVF